MCVCVWVTFSRVCSFVELAFELEESLFFNLAKGHRKHKLVASEVKESQQLYIY